MKRRLDLVTAPILAVGIITQAVVLADHGALTLPERIQLWTVAAGVAILVAQLWRWRRYLTPHADMLLLMVSLGGSGMVLGLPADSSCHAASVTDTIRANSAMLVTGLLPGVFLSRCLQQARREGTLLWALTLDAIGMFLGMTAVSSLPFAVAARWETIVSHVLMLAGMSAGMIAGMILVTVVPTEVTRVLLSFRPRIPKLKIWEPR